MGNRPLHIQAEEYVSGKIKSGFWKPGEQIPTEVELAKTLSISRPTIRLALSRLVSQGSLLRIKGKGTFVKKEKLLHKSTSLISSYRQESEQQGLKINTRVVSLETVKADAEIANNLNIKNGARVTALTRIRSVDGFNDDKPVVLTTVYVSEKIFANMIDIDFNETSFYEAMEENGIVVKKAQKELEAVLAPDEVTELLGISHFEPTLLISSIGMTESGECVEYSKSYYPAGCSKFLIETQR